MLKNRVFKIAVFIGMLFCVSPVVGQNYDFKSYHLYTNDEDKYLPTNALNAYAKVCIDETNQKIELNLFNSETEKWMTFTISINYKMDLGFTAKVGTVYMCTNNANQTCGVCVVNTNDGTFIDLRNFHVGEQTLSCWVQS